MPSTYALVLLVLLLLLVILAITTWWIENRVLFCPSKNIVWTPTTNYSNVFVDKINGWYFETQGAKKVLLFCHGNSGNISHRSYIVDFCRMAKLNLFLFDYQGYGMSEGRPSIQSILDDGISAYNYVAKTYSPDDIIIWGESLGGAVAIYTAAKCRCYRLLVMSTFSSLDDVIRYDQNMPLPNVLSYFLRWSFAELPSKYYIQQVICPIAIIHSPQDTVIPYRCAEVLYDAIRHKDKILITIMGEHSTPIITLDNLKQLLNFCDLPYTFNPDIEQWLAKLQIVWRNHLL